MLAIPLNSSLCWSQPSSKLFNHPPSNHPPSPMDFPHMQIPERKQAMTICWNSIMIVYHLVSSAPDLLETHPKSKYRNTHCISYFTTTAPPAANYSAWGFHGLTGWTDDDDWQSNQYRLISLINASSSCGSPLWFTPVEVQ